MATQIRRAGFLLMTEINFTRLRKCPGADNGEINSKYSRLSIIQLSKANSPDNLLGGKKKPKQNQTSTTGQDTEIYNSQGPDAWHSS